MNEVSKAVNSLTTGDIVTLKRKEIRDSVKNITSTEARFLVDYYYIAQRERIRFDNQIRSMNKDNEPTLILNFMSGQSDLREKIMKNALDDYTKDHDVGSWMRSIHGIGPVTAAGLLAHIDITRAPTAGAIWSFAGIDGVSKWEKGQKRPFNATLKTLCYKIGEGFVKVSNNEASVYGKLYKERKALETAKNARGDFADQAANLLATKNYSKGTATRKCLEAGLLSPAHIHARARRYAVKMFLSHLHHVMYVTILNKLPPVPFAIAHLNHAHYFEIPNKNLIKDFVEPIEIFDDNDPRDEDEIR